MSPYFAFTHTLTQYHFNGIELYMLCSHLCPDCVLAGLFAVGPRCRAIIFYCLICPLVRPIPSLLDELWRGWYLLKSGLFRYQHVSSKGVWPPEGSRGMYCLEKFVIIGLEGAIFQHSRPEFWGKRLQFSARCGPLGRGLIRPLPPPPRGYGPTRCTLWESTTTLRWIDHSAIVVIFL